MEEEEENESMEQYEKYLQDAKFMIKNNKYLNKENNNINSLPKNDLSYKNLLSSVNTAEFNRRLNSLNKIYLSNSIEDNNQINNFGINDLSGEILEDKLINEQSNTIPKYNNIKERTISMKDNFSQKSSDLKIYDSNIINEEINNNNININIKELKEEISKLKFQIKFNQQKYRNYLKTYSTLKNMHNKNNLKYKKLYFDNIKKENDLREKYYQMEEKLNIDSKNKDKEYEKKINILKIKLQNAKENNFNLRKKLSNMEKDSSNLYQINNLRESELREKLFYQENELDKLKKIRTDFKQNFSKIEKYNDNIIKELNIKYMMNKIYLIK